MQGIVGSLYERNTQEHLVPSTYLRLQTEVQTINPANASQQTKVSGADKGVSNH
jgi:hypothetical protein